MKPAAPARQVIVYGTSWCGYCRMTREWLTDNGIAFVDKDIEQDSDAADELKRKANEQHVRPRGVPVVDAGGKLVMGFDPAALVEALRL